MSGEVLGVQLEMGVMGEVERERFREVWQERALALGPFSVPSSAGQQWSTSVHARIHFDKCLFCSRRSMREYEALQLLC
jgi:hypothetical protein